MFPLIDVVFLLLTFFMFALVVMVQLDVTNISLPEARAGERLSAGRAITLSIDSDGTTYIDSEEVPLELVAPRLLEARERTPEAQLFIALDKEVRAAEVFRVMDVLLEAGIRDLRFLREPAGNDALP